MSDKKEPKKKVRRYISPAQQKEIKKNVNTYNEWGSFNPGIRKINR